MSKDRAAYNFTIELFGQKYVVTKKLPTKFTL
jgi:hypothetical protein